MAAYEQVYGIYQEPPFSTNWVYKCKCGAKGGPVTDREKVRELFKEHRSACIAFQPQGQAMTTEAKETPPEAPSKPAAKKKDKAAAKPKGRKKGEQTISEAKVKASLEALKKGNTSLLAESKKLGFTHNGPLRAALRNLIGRPAYDKLMSEGKKTPPQAKAKKTPAKAKPAPAETQEQLQAAPAGEGK